MKAIFSNLLGLPYHFDHRPVSRIMKASELKVLLLHSIRKHTKGRTKFLITPKIFGPMIEIVQYATEIRMHLY